MYIQGKYNIDLMAGLVGLMKMCVLMYIQGKYNTDLMAGLVGLMKTCVEPMKM